MRQFRRRTWPLRQPHFQRQSVSRGGQGGLLEAARSFLLGVGKKALVAALIVGLSAVHPVLGATAAKAYSFYGHGMAGLALYTTYTGWKSGRESTPHAAGEAAKVVVGEATGAASGSAASSMVANLKQSGVIDQISKETNVAPPITSEMLRGTISSSMSQGFGDLAGYVAEKGS